MGLLTILKKQRAREREMRLLVLCVCARVHAPFPPPSEHGRDPSLMRCVA
jgi:hypothetical protein